MIIMTIKAINSQKFEGTNLLLKNCRVLNCVFGALYIYICMLFKSLAWSHWMDFVVDFFLSCSFFHGYTKYKHCHLLHGTILSSIIFARRLAFDANQSIFVRRCLLLLVLPLFDWNCAVFLNHCTIFFSFPAHLCGKSFIKIGS